MANQHVDLSADNGGPLVATVAICLSLSTISVALRTYTRTILMKNFQLDDWLMLVAQGIFIISCAFTIQGLKDGIGHHNAAVTNENAKIDGLKWQAISTATYIIDMMFIKLSIGVFLLRFSVQKAYTWILRISLVIITIWSTVIFFFDLFQCNPIAKQWDSRITGGSCASGGQLVAAAYSISVMTIVSDWLFALLPIPMLWKVKMTKQAKATVIAILSLGVFASVATLVRLRFLGALENTQDLLFVGTDAMIWTLVEPGVAIVASSLATIRPLLRAMKIRGFESTNNTYGTGRSSTARSAAKRSNAAHNSIYAPQDVQLTTVEHGATLSRDLTGVGITFEGRDKKLPDIRRDGDQGDAKSEVYVIEGNTSSPAWSTRDGDSARRSLEQSRSLEQIHDLEAQNQENTAIGLGQRDR